MQSTGDDSICYSQAALLASEQRKGLCWLWPQLVMKTLFSFLFQTMLPVWANCRKPELFTKRNELNPVHLVNNQAHISQCSPYFFYFLGGDKGTEALSEVRIKFRAPEWLCYGSRASRCSKELCMKPSRTTSPAVAKICPHLWQICARFSQFHGSNWLHFRNLWTLPWLVEASRLPHGAAIQWAWQVSQEKFIASLCNWKMHFWFSVELKLKVQLNKL